MIRKHNLSAQFDHHSNKYTMCTVQNDKVLWWGHFPRIAVKDGLVF